MTQSALDRMTLHADTLFTYDERGRMLCTNEPTGPGAPAPVFYLGRSAVGYVSRYRADAPSDLVEELEALCRTEPVYNPLAKLPLQRKRYAELIGSRMEVTGRLAGPVYRLSDRVACAGSAAARDSTVIELQSDDTRLLQPWLHEWLDYLPCARPFCAAVVADAAVSVCCSVRITREAHEAGVETAPEFRRRGGGTAAVAAWAAAVWRMKRAPLYSTSWENVASQGVARKLGMTPIGVDFSVG